MQSQTYPILLVEDNLFNQKVALAMLKKLGFTVKVAKNGQEAVEKIQEQQFCLVFMDCEMPVLSGYEATQQIRQHEQNQTTHTPIIAMTAHLSEEEQNMCLEIGMDDYITKPFSIETLRVILKKFAVL